MANTVIALKKSSVPTAQPTVLANGELAINYADGKLFYKHANGTILPFNTQGGNAFGTINANGTLVVAGSSEAVVTLVAGNNVTITGDAINDKITINATGGGGSSVNVGDTPPISPANGDQWWSSTLGKMFIYYADTDSSQWVESTSNMLNIQVGAVGYGIPYDMANTANLNAKTANDKANDAYLIANTAYDKANSANIVGSNAYNIANTANIIAIAAFDKANTGGGGSGSLTTYSANVGNGAANTYNVSHNLNSFSLLMSMREIATGYIIYPDLQQTTANNLVISFVDNPTANQYALLIAKVT